MILLKKTNCETLKNIQKSRKNLRLHQAENDEKSYSIFIRNIRNRLDLKL